MVLQEHLEILLVRHSLLLQQLLSHVLSLLKQINEDYSDEIFTTQEL